jgi:hypothetical protein
LRVFGVRGLGKDFFTSLDSGDDHTLIRRVGDLKDSKDSKDSMASVALMGSKGFKGFKGFKDLIGGD